MPIFLVHIPVHSICLNWLLRKYHLYHLPKVVVAVLVVGMGIWAIMAVLEIRVIAQKIELISLANAAY